MNKHELSAILLIVKKLGWNDMPAEICLPKIKQMVNNQQSLELDTVGEYDDFEETLLSIALWDKERITSTMYVSDYFSLANWHCYCNSGWDWITFKDFCALMHWAAIKDDILISEYEREEEDYDYYLECIEEAMYITKHC